MSQRFLKVLQRWKNWRTHILFQSILVLTSVHLQEIDVSGNVWNIVMYCLPIMDVARDGPYGGLRLHMLWMLLFLKGYPNGHKLLGICRATRKTSHYWVDAFLE